jgi:histidinol dehydrogenase
MQVIKNPSKVNWSELIKRPVKDDSSLYPLVSEIFTDISLRGDLAINKYNNQYDGFDSKDFKVAVTEIEQASQLLSEELKQAIRIAKENIEQFHQAQWEPVNKLETTPGVTCWRESRAIEKVGIYIPGGSAPLFSTVLMLGVPAIMAGCREVILCSPSNTTGQIDPAILYTANLLGISNIFRIGGIQAIGAMTFGTQTVPKVDKLFGPGNQYVTAAKQLAQQYGLSIDMPAGPSEVLIIADSSAQPDFVAADLLAQAEHGPDSQVMLLSDDESLINSTILEIEKQLAELPRASIAKQALENSKFILLPSIHNCMEFSNAYAPEHLLLAVENPQRWISLISNAGSVFLGHYSCESAGDYASGTNHTLPTNGYARAYSGVSLDSFLKKITFQELTATGIQNLGPAIELMAEAEQLLAHKNAVSVRLKKLKQ